MESVHSSSDEPQTTVETPTAQKAELSEQWFNERFESLIPKIQENWPDLARQTLEATKGSLEEVVKVISQNTGFTSSSVMSQLDELFNTASNKTKDFAESLEPLEKQLEELLDELNTTLRPKIEKPIRKRPLVAVGFAAGIGLILGLLISGGRK